MVYIRNLINLISLMLITCSSFSAQKENLAPKQRGEQRRQLPPVPLFTLEAQRQERVLKEKDQNREARLEKQRAEFAAKKKKDLDAQIVRLVRKAGDCKGQAELIMEGLNQKEPRLYEACFNEMHQTAAMVESEYNKLKDEKVISDLEHAVISQALESVKKCNEAKRLAQERSGKSRKSKFYSVHSDEK